MKPKRRSSHVIDQMISAYWPFREYLKQEFEDWMDGVSADFDDLYAVTQTDIYTRFCRCVCDMVDGVIQASDEDLMKVFAFIEAEMNIDERSAHEARSIMENVYFKCRPEKVVRVLKYMGSKSLEHYEHSKRVFPEG